MRELHLHHIKHSSQRSSSVRLRKRSNEVKLQSLKNRRRGNFGSILLNDGVAKKPFEASIISDVDLLKEMKTIKQGGKARTVQFSWFC